MLNTRYVCSYCVHVDVCITHNACNNNDRSVLISLSACIFCEIKHYATFHHMQHNL